NTSSLGPGKAPLDVNQVSLLIIYVERMWLAHPFLTGACSKDCRIAAPLTSTKRSPNQGAAYLVTS
ncbi:MAG: hypothetical protein ABJI96_15935, partial [Paracoccaceae bacterium]